MHPEPKAMGDTLTLLCAAEHDEYFSDQFSSYMLHPSVGGPDPKVKKKRSTPCTRHTRAGTKSEKVGPACVHALSCDLASCR